MVADAGGLSQIPSLPCSSANPSKPVCGEGIAVHHMSCQTLAAQVTPFPCVSPGTGAEEGLCGQCWHPTAAGELSPGSRLRLAGAMSGATCHCPGGD